MERHPRVLESATNEVGLNQRVQDAYAKISLMEAVGVNNAQFRNYFHHDLKTGISVFALIAGAMVGRSQPWVSRVERNAAPS